MKPKLLPHWDERISLLAMLMYVVRNMWQLQKSDIKLSERNISDKQKQRIC
eukprot:m.27392 g.27392  ORF g.27392 m.27392 type:complete len:51 (+) comp13414_c0_seq3:3310-3462(+)